MLKDIRESWFEESYTFRLLEHLREGLHGSPRMLIVAAHPDDEVASAGTVIRYAEDLYIIHTTDGAPKDLKYAKAASFRTRGEYARARRQELLSALRLARIPKERAMEAGFVDQEASFNLFALTVKLKEMISAVSPGVVFTLPYEGGHPDHDSTAFAVHAALRLIERETDDEPFLVEYASYHANGTMFAAMEFLPAETETVTVVLTEEERAAKESMINCFATQCGVLKAFPRASERYRRAPLYDFTSPPHKGKLYYENFDWGITGADWREKAKEALADLEIIDLV